MQSAFALSEFARAEFGMAELARDLRFHADAVGAPELRTSASARGAMVVNVVGSASLGEASNPAPQAVNNAEGIADWQLLADAGVSAVSLATGSSLLRISPSALGGYAMTAAAAASIAFVAFADGTADSDAFARLVLEASAVSSVLAHTFGTADLRITAVCDGSMGVYATAVGTLVISSAGKAQAMFNGLAQAQLRLPARSYASAISGAGGLASVLWLALGRAAAAAGTSGVAQVSAVASAAGGNYQFAPSTATAIWLGLSLAYSSVLANRAASGKLTFKCQAHGQSVMGVRGIAELRVDAWAERGTNRLKTMPQGYATVNRPYENRTTIRPAQEREAVST